MSGSPRRDHRDPTSTACRVWHPSASAGGESRVVFVVIDCVDEAAARAADYAERIPAMTHRALLVTPLVSVGLELAQASRLRGLSLQVVGGADPLAMVPTTVTATLAEAEVHDVVVLLAPTRCTLTTSTRWRRLATRLRRIDGVEPILVPPASL